MNHNWIKIIVFVLVIILGVAIISAITGGIFMLLWNWLVPMFWSSAPILTFWQAWGLFILINLIFRSQVKTKRNEMD